MIKEMHAVVITTFVDAFIMSLFGVFTEGTFSFIMNVFTSVLLGVGLISIIIGIIIKRSQSKDSA